MGVTSAWVNEQRTIACIAFQKPWTWEEYYLDSNNLKALLDEIDYKAHVIVDITESGSVPKNALSELRGLFTKQHPNTGTLVIVGADNLLQTLFNIAFKAYHRLGKTQRIGFVSTLPEAYEHLNIPLEIDL